MSKLVWLLVLIFAGSLALHAEVLFYDNFDRPDGPVGNGWTNVGSPVSAISGNAMRLESNNGMGIRREFDTIDSGIYYIKYDWKIAANNWYADCFPTAAITHLIMDDAGNVCFDVDGTLSDPVVLRYLGLDTWATVLLKVNLDTDLFSVWIDGVLAADNIPGTAASSFYRFTFRAGLGATVTQYVDNFIIYNDISPAIPANFSATGSVNEITLTWDPAPITDFLSYRIYRDTASPATTLLTEIPGTQNQYVDNSAAPNTDYWYRVKAVFMDTIESGFSDEAMAHLQPQISVNPQELDLNIGTSLDDSTNLILSNTGNYPLTWNILPPSESTLSDLVAYYPFNGNANDESGNNHHGVLYNGASLTSDRFGNPQSCLLLDGINDYVDVGDWQWGGPVTFSVWAYNTSSTSGQRIIGFSNSSNNSAFVIYRQTNNRIVCWLYTIEGGIGYSLGWDYVNTIQLNTWMHFVATFDSDNMSKFYINGNLLDQHSNFPPDNVVRVNQFFGKSIFGGDPYYQGLIDDVMIFDRAITAQEVTSLYNSNTLTTYNIMPNTGVIQLSAQQLVTIHYTPPSQVVDPVSIADTLYIDSNSYGSESVPVIVRINIDRTPPSSVTNILLDDASTDANQIGITWTANTLADSVVAYSIYRRGRDETNWSLKGTVPASQLWFIDNQFTGLDSTYVYYRVRAVDWVGNLGAEGDSLQAALERFLAPENLQIAQLNGRDVQLTWNPVTQTISGLPGTPSCYIVYKSQAPTPLSEFDFLDVSFATQYIHPWALYFQPANRLFYVVTAYGGNMSRLDALLAEKQGWKYDELQLRIAELVK